jgi:hypothetical protein
MSGWFDTTTIAALITSVAALIASLAAYRRASRNGKDAHDDPGH